MKCPVCGDGHAVYHSPISGQPTEELCLTCSRWVFICLNYIRRLRERKSTGN